MPNWCECDLTVEGEASRVRAFLARAAGEEGPEKLVFDFNRFAPYPEHFDALDRAAAEWEQTHSIEEWESRPADGFNHGGREWLIEHWGTKWNARRGEAGEGVEWQGTLSVTLHFETAWSPPVPVVEKAAQHFPELDFELRYFERLGTFNGCVRWEAGTVVFDESGPYFGDRGG